jgi:hypothetical protein
MSLGNLAFDLPPKKVVPMSRAQSTPDSLVPDSGSGPVSFAIDYSRLRTRLQFETLDADAAWKDLDPSLSYTSLLNALSQLTVADDLPHSLFNPVPRDDRPHLNEIRRFIDHFPLILPPMPLVAFLGAPILDSRNLLRMLSPKASVLFCSAMALIHAVLQPVETLELRQSLIL